MPRHTAWVSPVLAAACLLLPSMAGTQRTGAQKAGAQETGAQKTSTQKTGAQATDPLKPNLPKPGSLKDGRPIGKGWVSLLPGEKLEGWKAEPEYWSLKDGVLLGRYEGGPEHHHAYTEKEYGDFELQCLIKMAGEGANSGVCIRLQPTSYDDAPGYQVDMGPGYWGCLWEERRAGMVAKFDKKLADKQVHPDGYNHYYVVAKGHHIQAWLNGVKTIDVVHEEGFDRGKIGFQLCHGNKVTNVDVSLLAIREMKAE